MTGQIVILRGMKRFGFILPDGAPDTYLHRTFFHTNDLAAGSFHALFVGQRVSFDPDFLGRGSRARNVRPLPPSHASPQCTLISHPQHSPPSLS